MEMIDKAAVVAEIERKIEAHKETLKNCDSSISEMVLKGSMSAYQNFLHFLNTLEMKKVDLEKEFDRYTKSITAQDIKDEPFTQLFACAKHFFELGLKAKKGE